MLKNPVVSEILNSDQDLRKMKDFNDKLFSSLHNSYKSYFKKLNNDKFHEQNLTIFHFLPIPVLFGQSRNDARIEFIFNLLSNKTTGELLLTDDVRSFIFSLFAISSHCQIFIYQELSEESEDIKKEIEQLGVNIVEIYDFYQVKDCIHCADLIVEELFSAKKQDDPRKRNTTVSSRDSDEKDKNQDYFSGLTFTEFMSKINNSGNLQKILTPSGLRNFMNNNNVD